MIWLWTLLNKPQMELSTLEQFQVVVSLLAMLALVITAVMCAYYAITKK